MAKRLVIVRLLKILSMISLLIPVVTVLVWIITLYSVWGWSAATLAAPGADGRARGRPREELARTTVAVGHGNLLVHKHCLERAPIFDRWPEETWKESGFQHQYLLPTGVTVSWLPNSFAKVSRYSGMPSPIMEHTEYVTIPLWIVESVALLPCLAFACVTRVRSWRAAAAQKHGSCPNCGYDLRATPERCPECGTEVRSQKS